VIAVGIRVRDLGFAYPDGTVALEAATFEIVAGESVAVVGANGAGKSTLLLHLAGILTPARGSVELGATRVQRATLSEVRKMVGLVFQDPDDQLFMPTVREDVAFGPLNLGVRGDEIDARVQEALSAVGALALIERPSHRLSFGEKRAVAIATVLSMRPGVLVLDEPSSNLDPRARRRLIELLRGLDTTLVVATHDLDLAAEVCSRTIVMDRGRVAADGPTSAIFSDKGLLERSGLEQPLSMRACPVCSRPS